MRSPASHATSTTRRGRFNLLRARGLLVIVLWQAPIGPVARSDGSVAFLFGAGADEFADVSCEGNLLDARRMRYRVFGVEADRDISTRVRINATAGLLTADIEEYGGPFAATQLQLKYRYLGLGAGVYRMPSMDEFGGGGMTLPSAHVRIGSQDNVHFRADVLPPIALGPHQIMRAGIGFNASRRDRPSGFIGLAAIGHDEGRGGFATDLDVPLTRRAALTFRGHYATGHRHDLTAGMFGGRVLFY